MPVFKRYPKRKTYSKKQTSSAAVKIAKGALAAVKKMRPETKHFRYNVANGTGISSTGGLIRFTAGLGQGVTEQTRIGQVIRITSVQLKMLLAAGSGGSFVRMIMFVDKEMDGVLPVVTDLLNTADIRSPYNTDNLGRFRIIEDKTVSVVSGATTQLRPVNRYWRLGSKCQFAKVGDGSTADSLAGQPFLLLITDVTTDSPNYGLVAQVNFQDS